MDSTINLLKLFYQTQQDTNITIVGDWFSAEARIPSSQGYKYTIFDFFI